MRDAAGSAKAYALDTSQAAVDSARSVAHGVADSARGAAKKLDGVAGDSMRKAA